MGTRLCALSFSDCSISPQSLEHHTEQYEELGDLLVALAPALAGHTPGAVRSRRAELPEICIFGRVCQEGVHPSVNNALPEEL